MATSPALSSLAGILSLALLVGAGTPAAADSGAVEAPTRASDERPRTRLLRLSTGQVLRGPSRQTEAGWQIKRRGDWLTLADVEHATLERDLLAEARKRESKLGRDDHQARAAHARWLSTVGLYPECLKQLDRVLDAAPDQRDVLELVAERAVPVVLPALSIPREPFFVNAARMTPSVREMAVQTLARETDRPGLLEDLHAELTARAANRRAFAALALRRLFPGEDVMGLVRRAVLDPVAEVRESASRALRDAENVEVAQPVISALGSAHSVVRRQAAQALATMNYPVAVGPLVSALQSSSGYQPAASNIFVGRQTAYVQDFDVEVAQSEGIADPSVNVLTEGAVLDARVMSLSTSNASLERSAIYKSLTRLTGAKVARSASGWQKWWDANGAAWRAAGISADGHTEQ